MSNRPPWKLAIIGAVAVIAGVALLLADWTLPELAAFVAMFFVARGALHLVTTSFDGIPGALDALQGGGEVGVGLTLLVWPAPTLLVLTVVVGVWVIVRGIVDATIALATRSEHAHVPALLASSALEIALGIALILRPVGTVGATATTLGVLAVLVGLLEITAAAGFWQHRGRRPRPASVQSIASAS